MAAMMLVKYGVMFVERCVLLLIRMLLFPQCFPMIRAALLPVDVGPNI